MRPPSAATTSEAQRLAMLRDLVVLDSEPEQVFDSIARMASEVCGTPIALLSLVDEERQWFKANVGLPGVNETPRDVAFCDHAIRSSDLFEVPDATQDARFAQNPLVTGAPDIRFYAGAPLSLSGGARVGTLCVIDRRPRQLSAEQTRTLQQLGAIATQALEMRRNLIDKSLAVRSEYEKALSASEARHRALVEQQSELVGLCRPSGELVYANPAYARQFGRTPAQMVGANLFERVDPRDAEQVRAQLSSAVLSGEVCSGENRIVNADGQTLWVAWTTHLQHDPDGHALLHSVGRDVTARRLAEDALHASQQLLARQSATLGSVIESIPANVSIVDRDGVLQYANSSFERWCGITRDRIVGRSLVDVLGPEDYARSRPWIERVRAGETVAFEKEYAGRRDGAHMAITYVPLWDEQGRTDGFVQIAHDISRHRVEEGRLLQLSRHDPLTGLLNRSGFESYMERRMAAGEGATLAMLCIDLDRFKPVNDAHGHGAGDKLLQQFAQRLGSLVRPSDAVARLGGDEFAIVLAGIVDPRHACTVADKVVAAAREPFEIDTLQLTIGASVGVAWGVKPGEPWSALVSAADAMLYKAKGAGRGRRADYGGAAD